MTDEGADFHRGPRRSGRYLENLEEFTSVREVSLTVPCRSCGVPVNQPCVNEVTGLPLKKFPAHPGRVEQAKQVKA